MRTHLLLFFRSPFHPLPVLETTWYSWPRGSRPAARARVGAVAAALLVLGAAGGCLNDSLAPPSGTARLNVRRVLAQVNPGEQATVVIDVGYWTNGEELRPLPVTPSRISIAAGATVSAPLVVTLDQCIADPDAYRESSEGGDPGGCLLEVNFTLLDASDSEISSTSTVVNFPVTPGQTIELEDVVLSNVWSVEVAPIDTLVVGQTVTAVATARTKSGEVVSDATFSWDSYNTSIATVGSGSGVIQALSPGNVYIEAMSDGSYGGVGVTVVDSSFYGYDKRTPGGICVTTDGRTVCPGDSHESRVADRRGEGR